MRTSTTTLSNAICKAVATAARESDAPMSAWPEQCPGRWATATRVADLLGLRTAEISYHLHEMVERGNVVSAQPWPAGLRGYQPGIGWRDEAPLFALPDPIFDERQWMLDELVRWAALHGGLAPRRIDWSKAHDPERQWPRSDRIAALFEAEALDKGIRYFESVRCAADCPCSTGRHYSNEDGDTFCDGCFDCLDHCPHGTQGEWIGPSGWRYGLEVAGLETRKAGDQYSTPSTGPARRA